MKNYKILTYQILIKPLGLAVLKTVLFRWPTIRSNTRVFYLIISTYCNMVQLRPLTLTSNSHGTPAVHTPFWRLLLYCSLEKEYRSIRTPKNILRLKVWKSHGYRAVCGAGQVGEVGEERWRMSNSPQDTKYSHLYILPAFRAVDHYVV